jgi:hypothetical protein
MPGKLIPIEELKKKLIKLLKRKYEEPNRVGIQSKRPMWKINNKIQLLKATCRRRYADMAEIESIIKNWELMCYNCECQENIVAEPIGIDEAIEDSLGKY